MIRLFKNFASLPYYSKSIFHISENLFHKFSGGYIISNESHPITSFMKVLKSHNGFELFDDGGQYGALIIVAMMVMM